MSTQKGAYWERRKATRFLIPTLWGQFFSASIVRGCDIDGGIFKHEFCMYCGTYVGLLENRKEVTLFFKIICFPHQTTARKVESMA